MRQISPEDVLKVLLTAPGGLRGPEILRRLAPKISQPTLWRVLKRLRSEGRVIVEGAARATRYHAAERKELPALRSLRMHEIVARRLVSDPGLLAVAHNRLQWLRGVNPHGGVYHNRWQELLDGPLDRLLRNMVEPSEEARALRRESPFTTLVPRDQRKRVFESLRSVA